MIIASAIILAAGAIATAVGFVSIVAIQLDTIDGLFEIGLGVLAIGFILLTISLVKRFSQKKHELPQMKICSHCNAVLNSNQQYCHKCGSSIENEQSTTISK
ncbi:MAG: hypothetical protein IJC45_01920 [Clostridia bacterium]|nr:hypothetical protein [Clostridia bacterium]